MCGGGEARKDLMVDEHWREWWLGQGTKHLPLKHYPYGKGQSNLTLLCGLG